MKRARRKKPRLPNWKIEAVQKAIPLVRKVMLSLREAAISSNQARNKIRQIRRSGRHAKCDLIELRNWEQEAARSGKAVEEILNELTAIGAVCYDPIRCIVYFPFRDKGNLGYCPGVYAYSPFGEELYWRWANDQPNTKRDVKDR